MTDKEFRFSENIDLSDVESWEIVVNCCSAVDKFFPSFGLYDLTEGIYHGDPGLFYEKAQKNQHNYLLDQAKCVKDSRVIELGSGYGTLLDRIRDRSASGVGITISPEQACFCRQKELVARMVDYQTISDDWNKIFDCIIANGSMEQFVSPSDVADGKADEIYRNLFFIVHRLIDPDSPSRRFVTTVIHFIRKPENPTDLLKNPFKFEKGSDNFHYAILSKGWGGYYPHKNQLEQIAKGYFKLVE